MAENACKSPTDRNLSRGNSLTLLYTNLRSITNKQLLLRDTIERLTLDICVFTETWLNSKTTDSHLELCNYSIHRKDRQQLGGGVMILLEKQLKYYKTITSTKCEILAIDLFANNTPIRIIACYLPHFYDNCVIKTFFSELATYITTNQQVIVCGDFNAPLVDWVNTCFPKTSNYIEFSKFYYNNQPLHQHVLLPTRNLNILDLIFTKNNSTVYDIKHLLPSAIL